MASALSDSELRKQLIAHGQKSVGPITETTRPLYVKKLDKLIAEKSKSDKAANRSKASTRLGGRASTRSAPAPISVPIPAGPKSNLPDRKLFGFSSDDDSDKESAGRRSGISSRNKTRNTRSSGKIPARNYEPDPMEDEDEESEEDEEEEEMDSQEISSFTRPSLRRRSTSSWASKPPTQDNNSWYSRTPTTVSYTKPKVRPSTEPRQTTLSRFLPKGNIQSFQDDTEDQNTNFDEFSDSDLDEKLVDMTSKGINTSSFLDTSQYNSEYERPKSRRNMPNTVLKEVERDKEPRVVVPNRKTARKRNPCPDGNLTDDENMLQQHFKTKEDKTRYKWALHASKLLLLTAAVFFVILALMYVNIKGILPMFNFTQTDTGKQKKIFSDTGKQNILAEIVCEGKICNEKAKIGPAKEIADQMFDHLAYEAGMFECGYRSERKISMDQMKQHLLSMYKHDLDANGMSEDSENRKYSLPLALKLIFQYPEWKIKLYDKDMNEIKDKDKKVSFLESEEADMSIFCRIRKSVEKLLYYILLLIVVVIVALLGVAYYKYRSKQKEEEMKKVYELVERIIDILKQHHDRCQTRSGDGHDSYMAIVHVRDMLIPVKQRRKLTPLWNKAVNFLAANESRIRTEMQTIKGEEFEVWRWLSPSVNGGKVWQGQAFGENHEAGFNMLPFTPTPCLKIRNMFDNDVECAPNWHVRIQDAILEKCGTNHNIVHIAVDRSSKEGCVYVKCGSPDGAGSAYKALHGWWFDGNLVTVKFLRLERYHERFPGTAKATTPLQPSNTDRLSLSQPYHRSVLELS